MKEEIVIVSSKAGRYLMLNRDRQLTLKPAELGRPTFVSAQFHLYPLEVDTLRDLEDVAYRRRTRISYLYAFWPDLEDRSWRVSHGVRKVLS